MASVSGFLVPLTENRNSPTLLLLPILHLLLPLLLLSSRYLYQGEINASNIWLSRPLGRQLACTHLMPTEPMKMLIILIIYKPPIKKLKIQIVKEDTNLSCCEFW